jgi:hypothetical protein
MLILETQKSVPAPVAASSNSSNGISHSHFDDDLGFDPFSESSKALADLVMEEQ